MDPPLGGVSVDFDVPASMRDGTVLRADVYRPSGDGPWPTLLTRTPYGKRTLSEWLWHSVEPVSVARRGFLVVMQDVRGRFASDGDWHPTRFERHDGYDTVEWAATLPGSNGRVGMFGGSYCGNDQWLAAWDRPPALAAIAPTMTWCDARDGLVSRGGAEELGLKLWWSLWTSLGQIDRSDETAGALEELAADLLHAWDGLDTTGYRALPAISSAIAVPDGGMAPLISDLQEGETSSVIDGLNQVTAASFHTAGWYDVFLQGTLDNFSTMSERDGRSRLVIGPWTHEQHGDPVGERVFGALSSREIAPVDGHGAWPEAHLGFLAQHTSNEPDETPAAAAVRLFVMGRNAWRDEDEWPLSRAAVQRWYLQPFGGLSTDVPLADAAPSSYSYDPAHPVPTLGGATEMWPGYPSGAFEQRSIEARDDVLVFTSAPMDADLEVTGRVRLILHAETSAPSTDWVARLCDVAPDGRSYNLCDGIVRASVAEGGGVARYEVDLWSTSNVFLAGHCIRVHVTSSCFPRWDRNLNTGQQDADGMTVAEQRIHHGSGTATYIDLPVIDA
jgi:putative CocE/NonD family hydrolase